MRRDHEQNSGDIPATSWTLINLAAQPDETSRRAGLEQFLVRYLPAMRAHLILRRGWRADEVDDLLQEFVSSRLLKGDVLARAQRGRRFRNYLLTVLDHFASNQRRARQALKRAPDHGASLEAQAEHGGPAVARSAGAADIFDREWARQVLEEAQTLMKAQCEAANRMDLWEVFDGRIRSPLLEGTEPISYEALVERFGLKSPMQAANLLVSAKRAFERALREVIAHYCEDESQIDAEIADLIEILSRGGA